ncbi:helix-turn-helix domain-containing protein [Demequina sp.]|uniref:winged helix-turn-helix transcriptional regulator n=1 Tax=Demequina sp. TaxID=2050685 RepID=UPI0025F89587|nr:helix-turn-helix domain-containing protein [Demequina sp.]
MADEEWNLYEAGCPTRDVLDRIGDRWTVLLVLTLADGPLRYSELGARVQGISQKMLTQTLRGLERDGLATRRVFAQVPPRVEYELTDLGRTLLVPLGAIAGWATGHMGRVRAAREAFDAG